jgi:membrane-associated phospholipid phosphatase
MSSFLYRNRAFLTPFILLWFGVGYTQLFYSQNFIIVELNRLWTPFGDVFFSLSTYLGDGLFVIPLGLIALYYSYEKGILILVGFAISGILVQISKQYIFRDSYRPSRVLADVLPWLHTVAGVTTYQNASFPSGHTTSAFALFATLAFFSNSSYVKMLCLVPAIMVAYSRMYLLQHFLLDVHVGALLGTTTAILCCYYLTSWWEYRSVKWADLGLRDRIRKNG